MRKLGGGQVSDLVTRWVVIPATERKWEADIRMGAEGQACWVKGRTEKVVTLLGLTVSQSSVAVLPCHLEPWDYLRIVEKSDNSPSISEGHRLSCHRQSHLVPFTALYPCSSKL